MLRFYLTWFQTLLTVYLKKLFKYSIINHSYSLGLQKDIENNAKRIHDLEVILVEKNRQLEVLQVR